MAQVTFGIQRVLSLPIAHSCFQTALGGDAGQEW